MKFIVFLSLIAARLCLFSAVTQANAPVEIDDAHFPDANFRTYVSETYDADNDGILSSEELGVVTEMSVAKMEIADISGIEYFTSLVSLDCSGNDITALDVSDLDNLTELNCNVNDLTELDVSGMTGLTSLYCSGNQIIDLDISGCVNLTELACAYNRIPVLNVSEMTKLQYLSCYDNHITTLDVRSLTELKELSCGYTLLTRLDVSGMTSLTRLSCENSPITRLDVEGCTSLEVLLCPGNKLTSLDVSTLTSLKQLQCGKNQLTSLDVSGLDALKTLQGNGNQYSIPADNNKFDLSLLPGGFDAAKATKWTGGTVDANGIVTVNKDAREVSYTYDIGGGKTLTFALVPKEWKNPYSDLPASILNDPEKMLAIRYVTERGFMVGTSADPSNPTFSPDMILTRAQYVTLFGRLAGIDPDDYKYTGQFSDVEEKDWFAPYAAWAIENELIFGYGDGTFGDKDKIDTQQALVLLQRFADFLGKESKTPTVKLDTYPDGNEVSTWATDGVAWALENGIYEPDAQGKLNPGTLTSRMMTASLAYRFDLLLK